MTNKLEQLVRQGDPEAIIAQGIVWHGYEQSTRTK